MCPLNTIERSASGLRDAVNKLPYRNADDCYQAGFDSAISGPNVANTHFTYFLTPEKAAAWESGRKAGERLKTTILPFGVHIGKALCDASVPDDYVAWMANGGEYTDPNNRFEVLWKVPSELRVLARREMERRGYRRVDGERYEKER